MSALPVKMELNEAKRITERIRLLVNTITETTEKVVDLIEQAKAGDAWRALGYDSWTAYVSVEFASVLEKLTKAERIPIVAKLSETGMSTRAIAPIVGVSNKTVHNDIVKAGVTPGNTSPEKPAARPGRSLIGAMIRDAWQQEKLEAEKQVSHTGTPEEKVVTVKHLDGERRSERIPIEKISNVIGLDGKRYLGRDGRATSRGMSELAKDVPPVKRKPPRRPITDAYRDAMWDLHKVVERLERLTEDDRFARNADALYELHGNRMEQIKERLHDKVAMPLVRGGRDA